MSIKCMVKPRFWVIIMLVMVALFMCVYTVQGRMMEKRQERIAELEAKRALCANENSVLQRKIDFTKTNTYVERVAHDELSLLYEDETRYVFGEEPSGDAGTAYNG